MKDSLSLPNNRISCIGEDGDGNLWVGTKLGAYSAGYDGEFSRFYYYAAADSKVKHLTNPINYFMKGAEGTFLSVLQERG